MLLISKGIYTAPVILNWWISSNIIEAHEMATIDNVHVFFKSADQG